MASIFREYDKNGKAFPDWRYRFRDEAGRWKRGKGWPDAKKTRLHALQLEADARAVRKGEKSPAPSWEKTRGKPISEVTAEYLSWGNSCGGRFGRPWGKVNAWHKAANLKWWTRELGLTVLADIDLARVEKIQRRLQGEGKAPKTIYLKIEALRSLCLWAVRRGLLGENPLRSMGELDTRPVKAPRPLDGDELRRLLAVAPPERRLAYSVALATGFRVGEVRALTVASFDRFGPSLFLGADHTKNRMDARQPITRELADKLAPLTIGKEPTAPLLDMPGGKNGNGRHFREDLRAAGIPVETPAGPATFHSLRKSFDNAILRSGADLKTAMTLMRHHAASLTLSTYASPDPKRLRETSAAAAEHLKAVMEAESCPAGVRRAAVAGGDGDLNPDDSEGSPCSANKGGRGATPRPHCCTASRLRSPPVRPWRPTWPRDLADRCGQSALEPAPTLLRQDGPTAGGIMARAQICPLARLWVAPASQRRRL